MSPAGTSPSPWGPRLPPHRRGSTAERWLRLERRVVVEQPACAVLGHDRYSQPAGAERLAQLAAVVARELQADCPASRPLQHHRAQIEHAEGLRVVARADRER